jgi:acetyl-CoA carboxylase carboxyltransferase component
MKGGSFIRRYFPIRDGAKLLYAYAEATVPKISIVVRKAFGGAYIAMSSKHLGADFALAYPTAQIAVMGTQGAINVVHRKNPNEEQRTQFAKEYAQKYLNPNIAAELGYIDEVIHPADTRQWIAKLLNVLDRKEVARPKRKHGLLPI